jgi:hypothetical protein
MKPHKHADVIKAWADGHPVQVFFDLENRWLDLDEPHPHWNPMEQYRIKPNEPKPPVVRWLWATNNAGVGVAYQPTRFMTDEEASTAIECGAIKLEWSRTEFPE